MDIKATLSCPCAVIAQRTLAAFNEKDFVYLVTATLTREIALRILGAADLQGIRNMILKLVGGGGFEGRLGRVRLRRRSNGTAARLVPDSSEKNLPSKPVG